jgi:hypothetical protein
MFKYYEYKVTLVLRLDELWVPEWMSIGIQRAFISEALSR